jgi:hypothetical protein
LDRGSLSPLAPGSRGSRLPRRAAPPTIHWRAGATRRGSPSLRRRQRIAFAWLLAAPSYFGLGASRHALGQGFFLTLIVALGARILPGFSGWAIAHPRYLEGVVSVVTAGAALRVLGEIGLAVSLGWGGPFAAAGGALGVAGFVAFGVALVREVGKRPGLTA